jgi:hypothetical protein
VYREEVIFPGLCLDLCFGKDHGSWVATAMASIRRHAIWEGENDLLANKSSGGISNSVLNWLFIGEWRNGRIISNKQSKQPGRQKITQVPSCLKHFRRNDLEPGNASCVHAQHTEDPDFCSDLQVFLAH